MLNEVNIPILSMIEATVEKVKEVWYKKVWVVSSQTTKDFCIYWSMLEENDIDVIFTERDEQNDLNRIIEKVMWWHHWIDESLILEKIFTRMAKEWAESVILWCTELPLAVSNMHEWVFLHDTMDILVQKSIKYAKRK
jgi:aspartate racemase